MERIIIHADGGARGNPGPAGAGAVLTDERGKALKEISEYLGEATNNTAEYEALLRALRAAVSLFQGKLRGMQVDVFMDSELVVRQLQGVYKVKNPALREKFSEVEKIKKEYLPRVSFTHVRREKNKRADALVNEAIDKALGIRAV